MKIFGRPLSFYLSTKGGVTFLLTNLIYIIIIIGLVVFVIYYYKTRRERMNQLRRYINIYIGMSEKDMLSIMGSGYSKSSYSDNRYKYEWLANGSKTKVGNDVRGIGKVDIYVKDGYVDQISPYNI